MKHNLVIWFDISHPAQLNFYLNPIKRLSEDFKVVVSVLNRGKLIEISQKELNDSECELIPLGFHKGTKFSAIFDANLKRIFQMVGFYLKVKPQISLGNGYMHGVISRLFGFTSIMFNDDLERTTSVFLMKCFGTELFHISDHNVEKHESGVKYFKGLKEWSYLSPRYFSPDEAVLKRYELNKGEYLFIREVSTGSINYSQQNSNLIASISDKIPKDLKVIFSLEDKDSIDLYPENWILLEEPLDSIHSLMYYSKAVISSGDSMAREGAVLGVPSVYCGVRNMQSNDIMVSRGRLFHLEANEIPKFIDDLDSNAFEMISQVKFREILLSEWQDVTQLAVGLVRQYLQEMESN